MEIFDQILYGFQVAFLPANVLSCFIGVVLGTLVGVLPGLGPIATMSMLLPVTLKMSPVSAVIMLAGIYYGAQYGGSITSILVNVPGEATTVVTCLDGYKMAQKGRGGPALGISAIGSFIGGTLSLVGVMFLAAPIASFALQFGPPEYFAICFLAMTVVTSLAAKSTIKGFISAMMGMLAGTVGMDLGTGIARFTFGIQTLADGIGLVPVIMGLFGVGEILLNVERLVKTEFGETKIGRIWPSVKDWIDSRWAILRGTVIGFVLGLIPGSGAIISPFVSYAVEKKLSRHPEKFGTGIIEGVAAPETANNASSQASFIPLLSLGIPSNVVTAVLLGALMIYGVEPGPLLMSNRPDMFWGVITSMYLGNIMLVILNMPLIGLWVQILKVPYRILLPLILLFCLIGVYSINGNVVEIWIMAVFGLVGYLMNKCGYEAAPFVMGLVLSPLVEDSFRQSLVLSEGSFMIFFSRPLSGIIMCISAAVMISYCVPMFKKKIEIMKENVSD